MDILAVVISGIGLVLTGVYVILTLRIANKTAESVETTKDALVASQWQSQQAIDAVNRQILASEQQAREALYNQHKPVIVPISGVTGIDRLTLGMQNKGSGVALNTWGFLTITNTGKLYRFESTYFLVPDKLEKISIYDITSALDFIFPDREFIGFSIYPQPDSSKTNSGIRLMVTYNDAFGNKYLVIFDSSDLFGWRQCEDLKRIEQRLDEYFVQKRLFSQQKQLPTSEP